MNCCYLYTPEHDNAYKNLLFMSLDTLIHFYKNNIENIYIIINDITNNKTYNDIENKLNELTANNNIKTILKLVDLNITNIIKYPENNMNKDRINRIGLVKFFIPDLVDVDSILYIDCDILFKDNIYDELVYGFNDNILLKMYHEGFNSGLIFFNCKKWRENKELLFNEIIDFYKKNENINFVDNECFRWLVQDNFNNICFNDNNKKINVPTYINEWENQNVIHIWGELYDKILNMNKMYKYIMKP